MRWTYPFLALVFSTLSFNSATAGLVETPYTQRVIVWNSEMDRIGADLGLDEDNTIQAKRAAAIWISMGPCQAPEAGDEGVLTLVLGGTSSKFSIAVYAMITVLARENMGRTPLPEVVCRFAAEMR